MRTVIERKGQCPVIDRKIRFDDRPSTYKKAEEIAGRRLDRRKNYAIIDGEVCESMEHRMDCTGCTETEDGHIVNGPCGCRECGYTGISVMRQWIPLEGEVKP